MMTDASTDVHCILQTDPVKWFKTKLL